MYRWSVIIVLACFVAGIVEIGLFISAVHTSYPNWNLALAASQAGIVTSLICIVSGVVGARQRPTLGISELGVVVGVVGLLLTLMVEAVSHICWVCL